MTREQAQRLQNKLLPEIATFKNQRKTLQLATQCAKGFPNASYVPFAVAQDGFYILVSELARHGTNLKACSRVSVMLVEDEKEAKNVFARKRLTFDANAEIVPRTSALFNLGINALSERFGEMIENLAELTDFNLFKVKLHHGLYVKGFGQAFKLTGADLNEIDWQRDGHRGTPDAVLAEAVTDK